AVSRDRTITGKARPGPPSSKDMGGGIRPAATGRRDQAGTVAALHQSSGVTMHLGRAHRPRNPILRLLHTVSARVHSGSFER
ncbi:MAG: hypothetical protein Q7U26_02585, partial [Aquabacterium sp.]|nr:hypothetical protein [Aquabacterium sp.]